MTAPVARPNVRRYQRSFVLRQKLPSRFWKNDAPIFCPSTAEPGSVFPGCTVTLNPIALNWGPVNSVCRNRCHLSGPIFSMPTFQSLKASTIAAERFELMVSGNLPFSR